MILPAASDSEIRSGGPKPYEAVVLKNPLGGDVVGQRAGLDAMQAKSCERHIHDLSNRGGAKPAAIAGCVDPIAHVARLKRATHDVGKRHATDDVALMEDHVRDDRVALVLHRITRVPRLCADSVPPDAFFTADGQRRAIEDALPMPPQAQDAK